MTTYYNAMSSGLFILSVGFMDLKLGNIDSVRSGSFKQIFYLDYFVYGQAEQGSSKDGYVVLLGELIRLDSL